MNDCAIKRAEVGNFLNDFYAKNAQAEHLNNQGNATLGAPFRNEATLAVTKANKAADQLSLRVKDAQNLITELKG